MINHLIDSSNKKSNPSKTIRNLLLKEIFPTINDQNEMMKIFGLTKRIVFLFVLGNGDLERLGLVFDDFLLDNLLFYDFFVMEEKNCRGYLEDECFVKPPLLKVFSKKRSIIEIPIGSNWRRVFYNLLKNFAGDE